VEGYEVTGIAKDAFSSTYFLEEIKLPATITTIDENAFYFCYAEKINIPEGIASFPKNAFFCSKIKRIIIPASVQSIGSNAFYRCDDLAYVCMEAATPINIPEDAFPTRANVTLYVPYGSKVAYEGTDYWKEFKEIIELPEDMTGIYLPGSTFTSKTVEGIDVLYTVTSLNPKTVKVASNAVNKETTGTITIPSKVEGYEVIGVEKKAFESIRNLTKIILPPTITTLDENAFYFCYAQEIIIPKGITSFPEDAFYYCWKLLTMTIPASVESIGNHAFYNCNKLKILIVHSPSPATVTENTFEKCDDAILYVPKGSKDAYETADYWKEFKEIIELEKGDADGDGSIDVNDVTSTINYILGKPVASFIPEAADVDGDDTIDVNDVQGIIDIALGKKAQ
jgi:hypothetical protein